jgi:ClpP class serine protease
MDCVQSDSPHSFGSLCDYGAATFIYPTMVCCATSTGDPRNREVARNDRQERRSLFGVAVARHIDLEDAQTIIAAIMDTPGDMPIDLVIHTPGGLVLAALQIARGSPWG